MKKQIIAFAAVTTLMVSGASFGSTKASAANTTNQKLVDCNFANYQDLINKFGKSVNIENLDGLKSVAAQNLKDCNLPTVKNNPNSATKKVEQATPQAKKETVKETPKTTTTTQTEKPTTPNKNATTTTPASSGSNSSTVSEFEKQVAELVNQERAKQGLAALTLDTEVSKVARIKSQDMKDKNYFSHTSPTYGSPFDMMEQFGISYKAAGENIAYGQTTPQQVMEAWMNSEGHKANILNSSYTHIGVGYVADGHYWTQMFVGK